MAKTLVPLTVRVPSDLQRWLEKEAQAKGEPLAAWIREQLDKLRQRYETPAVSPSQLVAEIEARAAEEARGALKMEPATLAEELARLEEERAELEERARNASTVDLARIFDDRLKEIVQRIKEIRATLSKYEDLKRLFRAKLAAWEVKRLAAAIESVADELGELLGRVHHLASLVGDPALAHITWLSIKERLCKRVPQLGIRRPWHKSGDLLQDLRQASPAFNQVSS